MSRWKRIATRAVQTYAQQDQGKARASQSTVRLLRAQAAASGSVSGHPNTAEEQRARVLDWLRRAPLTTLEARSKLDVMHPAARVMELRKAGHYIETITVREATPCGQLHSAAHYVLRTTGDGHTLPLPMRLDAGGRAAA